MEVKYFNRLVKIIDRGQSGRTYKKALKYLHEREFEYTMMMDKNRFYDGIDIRHRLGFDDAKEGCSILEMMVALAWRMEETIMDDPAIGDRTSQWFWKMMQSLGMNIPDDDFDEDEAEEIIETFLDRDYEPNGKGGLFTLRHCECDLRNVEIWNQMLWWLDEN